MKRHITWYSLFLNQPVFQENKIYNFKIYLCSFLNTKQIFWTRLGKILIWQKFSGTWESDFKTKLLRLFWSRNDLPCKTKYSNFLIRVKISLFDDFFKTSFSKFNVKQFSSLRTAENHSNSFWFNFCIFLHLLFCSSFLNCFSFHLHNPYFTSIFDFLNFYCIYTIDYYN